MKKICSVLLTISLFFGICAGVPFVYADETSYHDFYVATGDVVYYGNYPQTRITDASTLLQLSSIEKVWHSYDYYQWLAATDQQSDFMQYADFVFNGEKYRAVQITGYRSPSTSSHVRMTTIPAYINGYSNGTYYFKYEPLKWILLDTTSGYMICSSIIDSQAYQTTMFNLSGVGYLRAENEYTWANNYKDSTIRQWLNQDFYNTAFTAEQRANIATTLLENNATDSAYDSSATNDKIFLLSKEEFDSFKQIIEGEKYTLEMDPGYKQGDYINERNLYVSSVSFAKSTDYAQYQGLNPASAETNKYWLRTAGSSSELAIVAQVSDRDSSFYSEKAPIEGWCFAEGLVELREAPVALNQSLNVDNTTFGIRPVMVLNEVKDDTAIELTETHLEHTWDAGVITTPATCSAKGVKTFTCTVCGETKTEETAIDASNHVNTKTAAATNSTCVTHGFTAGVYCNDCKRYISGHTEKALADHTWNSGEITTAAT